MTGPRGLRWLAAVLLPGRDGRYIRTELDEAFARDIARGMSRSRAWRRYVANAFGSAVSVWRSRRPPELGISWLDVKLGLRMLVKHPGLTAVSLFALAIGIPVGLAPAHFVNAVESPFPVPEGDRIRAIRLWNTTASRVESATAFEYTEWRGSLTAFETLGALRTAGFNIEVDGASGEPVAGVQMTSSVFDLLRVAPALGRTLRSEDEVMGAPDVVVIGHDLWRARLGSDPAAVGRTIRIGGVPHTVVGVMPRSFRFPMSHQIWVPMREAVVGAPGLGLPVSVLGRLADGATEADAQRQLTGVGEGLRRSFPQAYEQLRPEVVHAAYMMVHVAGGTLRSLPALRIAQGLTLLLLMVACTNVALLIYARTATRSAELAVRTALGASRARIVTQVFTECLVLAVLAAGAGLVIIDLLPRVLPARVMRFVPWWIDFGVTPRTVAWALGLAGISAVTAGVLPALRLTGRAVQRNIQRARAQRSGVRFGGMTTMLVAADVAIALTVTGAATAIAEYLRQAWNGQAESVGFAAEQYLAAELRLPWTGDAAAAGDSERERRATRLGGIQQRLVERIEAEPGVLGVAVASVLPRMSHPTRVFELDDDAAGAVRGHRIKVAHVAPGFFDAFHKPVLAGRDFDPGDLEGDRDAVIVNTAFVSEVLSGGDPIGRRIRYAGEAGEDPGPWYRVVGLVAPLGMDIMATTEKPGLYHALAPGETQPWLAIHVTGDPEAFTPRLRAIAAEVDPTSVITSTTALDRVFEGDWMLIGAIVLGGVLLVAILIALASSAIYAMMSFAVEQRTREIGIRAALGAKPGSLVYTITRRALFQVGIGTFIGLPAAIFLFTGMLDGPQRATDLLRLAPGLLLILAIAATACAAPARRALRIDPTEALREG